MAYTTAYGSEMIVIPAGTFSMGSGMGDPYAYFIDHDVTLTHDFYLGMTEVTRGEWESWSGGVGWIYNSETLGFPCTTSTTSADCPADSVSWYDVARYANALSTAEGLTNCYLSDGTDLAAAFIADPYSCPGYRLPTEAEWEYAARGGDDTTYSGSDTAAMVAWTNETAGSLGTYSHQVATLSPNAWGLFDMSGNLYEWTGDWLSNTYDGYGTGSPGTDPPGPSSGSYRAVRDAGWATDAMYATVADRSGWVPGITFMQELGFRLARTVP